VSAPTIHRLPARPFPRYAVSQSEQPAVTAERPHGLKYSLFHGRQGERIIGYDNEAAKGDHRHYRGKEKSYRFTTYEELIRDFMHDVRKELRR
jgi:hypothetical protein